MNAEQIEQLAVKHEAFGFGQVDAKGYTTHGFDPDGLHAFVQELTEALVQERDAARLELDAIKAQEPVAWLTPAGKPVLLDQASTEQAELYGWEPLITRSKS